MDYCANISSEKKTNAYYICSLISRIWKQNRSRAPYEMGHEAGDVMIGQGFIILKKCHFFLLTFGAGISRVLNIFQNYFQFEKGKCVYFLHNTFFSCVFTQHIFPGKKGKLRFLRYFLIFDDNFSKNPPKNEIFIFSRKF